MGDRVSVSFSDGSDESVILFSHWGGAAFGEEARTYATDLCAELLSRETNARHFSPTTWPLFRFEPNTVMVDFVRWCIQTGWIHAEDRVESNFYFGATESDGDNSDNGHFRIDLPATLARVRDLRTKLLPEGPPEPE